MLSIKEIENIGFRLDTLLSRRDLLLPEHTAEVYEMAKAYVSLVEKIKKTKEPVCFDDWYEIIGFRKCLKQIKSFIDES